MVEHPGFFLSQDDDAPRAIGEPLEHRSPSHSPAISSETCVSVLPPRFAPAQQADGLRNRRRFHDPTSYSSGLPCDLPLLHPSNVRSGPA
ncbi:hypothetical protein HMPREF0724_12497 [Prescottella equi ATCC 33707]|uniref:Uncharacterized protein n=1 Tax=Prescottella equi ATCC 33707 TaxID=525370 RepID=E9T1N4_RHOHA|nr:hypothetical protein HMPREF0724_12497 [Prescottella equi ATCC 33707]